MAPLLRLGSRASSSALLLLLATASFAGTKFDLSPYLGNVGQEGDFRVFTWSTRGERTVTLLELEPWKMGWRGLFESKVTGAGEDFDGTVRSEGFLIPGRQLLSGSDLHDDRLLFFARKPAKGLRLLVTPGKVQRTNQRRLAILDGVRIGNVDNRDMWSMDGFETVETLSGTYENALRAKAFSKEHLHLTGGGVVCPDGVCGNELVQLTDTTLWYAEGVGLVRADIDAQFLVNGSLIKADSWSEELSSGRLDGVPFPQHGP